jgi:hypothetical protein
MEVLKDGTGLANDVMAWGMGYGSQTPVFVRDTDATSQADHGLWQLSQISFGVYKQATIDRIAQSIIDGSPQNKRGAKNDRVAVQCVTYVPGLRPAQKVDFTSNAFGFNDVIPIRKMEIDFPAADTPKYSLTLSHEIDTPFGFFDPFLLHLPNPKCPPPLVMGPNRKCILPPIIHVGGCDCGITDTFTRDVDPGWGTNDAGLVWSEGVGSSGTFLTYDDGSQGFIGEMWVMSAGASMSQEFATSLPTPFLAEVMFLATKDGSDLIALGGLAENNIVAASLNVNKDTITAASASVALIFRRGSGIGNGTDPVTQLQFFRNPSSVFDYVTSPISVVKNVWYHLKFTFDASAALKAKIWAHGNVEPVSWVTSAISAPSTTIYERFSLAAKSQLSTNAQMFVDYDNLDITNVNRCTAVQFDNFERVVAPGGWGTATPSGNVWTRSGSSNGQSSVGAGYGFLQNGASATTETETIVTGLSPTGDFTATLDLYVNSDNNVIDASFIFASLAFGWHHNTGGAHPFLFLNDNSGGYTTVNFADSFWDVASGPVYMKVERIGTTARIKLWDAGLTAEPDWQLTGTVAAGYYTTEQASFSSLGTGAVGAQSVAFGSIDFDYDGKPCYIDGPLPSSVPSNAWVCEQFDVVTTTMTLAHSFLVNSPRVWLNGLLQPQSSYTQNGIAGTITFDFTPTSGDNARVCYWATA